MVRGTYRRVGTALLLCALLLLSPLAYSGGIAWDIGVACGYVCVVLMVCLYIFPVRGDGLPHARLLGLSQHRILGWCLLIAAILHIVVLLVAQPLSSRYLLPSAPVFMWCGIAAVILAGVLVQTGLSGRTAMRRSGSFVPATAHILLSAAMMLLVCAHLAGSGQFLSGWPKIMAALVLLALPLGWFAIRRRNPRPVHGIARRASHVVAMAMIAIVPSPLGKYVLLAPAARPARIAVNLPHEMHTSVSCVTCHHNYVDKTGGTTACIECHRSGRSDLKLSSEARFHTFCRDCHAQLAAQGAPHGPTRSCLECHQGIRSSSF